MKRILITTVILCELIFSWVQVGIAKDVDVVLRWAPIIEQRNYSQNNISRDNVFTRVNFDGDWRLNNNSINLGYYNVEPTVYYSLVESETHYYIAYYLYYPRHGGANKHEHDMIGALVAIQKSNGISNNVEMIDVILTYSNGKWRKWNGYQVRPDIQRLCLVVSAGTHEMLSLKPNELVQGGGAFYPMLEDRPNHAVNNKPSYRLVCLDELWQRRSDIGAGRTFNRWGYFDSYHSLDTAAPWVWQYKHIRWLARPAELMQYAQGIQVRPVTYLNNHYR